MRQFMKKWTVPGAALLLLALGLTYAFWPKPVAVDFGTVSRAPMLVTISGEGETRIRDEFVVSAPIAGQLRRFDGEVGDPVVAGESIVARINPTEPGLRDIRTRAELDAAVKAAEAARELAAADVDRLQAEYDYAQSEFERSENLADRGILSQAALDQAEMQMRTQFAALNTARANLKVREFELEVARTRLLDPETALSVEADQDCCFTVTAPVTGAILQVFQQSEAVVASGTPLIEIGDPRDLEIVVDLLSTDAVRIAPGYDVLIEGWGGSDTLAGKVRRIEPFGFTKISALGIEEQRVNVVIDFADPPERWSRLGHGYRVEVRIIEWRGEDVLQVPLSTLFRVEGDWALFKVEGGRAELSRVEVGHMNQQTAEILSGLEEGETVILFPSDRIESGVRVTARGSGG